MVAAGATTVATLDPPATVPTEMTSGMGSILMAVGVGLSLSLTAAAEVVSLAPPLALATCRVRAAEEDGDRDTEEDGPAEAANCCCSKIWLGKVDSFCFDCCCPLVVNMAAPS